MNVQTDIHTQVAAPIAPTETSTTNESEEPQQISSKKITFVIISLFLLLLTAGGVFWYFQQNKRSSQTLAEGQTIAESINPYIPEGFTVVYKAKMTELPHGGAMFDTQLVKGTSKIGILMSRSTTIDCSKPLEQVSGKSACVESSGDQKRIAWVEDNGIVYQVVSSSPDVSLEEIEKIVASL